jgi:hypothetical protein
LRGGADVWIQAASLFGAILILSAFGLHHYGRLARTDSLYNVANLVGASILAVVAWIQGQLGFLLLETVWAILSLAALVWRREGVSPIKVTTSDE